MSGGGGDGGSNFPSNPWTSPTGGAEGSREVGVGGVPGPSVTGAGREACEALEFEARLRNVDVGELGHVVEGDVLPVVYQDEPSRMVAVVRTLADGSPSPTPVGVLLDRLQELLPCLAVLPFEAEVTHIDGGNTRVQVRPAAA